MCRYALDTLPELTASRPTHDHIERLQARLDDLEGYLERLCALTGSEVVASLQRWKNEGESELGELSGAGNQHESLPRPSVRGQQQDEHSRDELLTFEPPMGGDYIYDRDG